MTPYSDPLLRRKAASEANRNMYVAKAKFQEDAQVNDSQMALFFSVGYFFSMFGKASAGAMSDTIGGYKVIPLDYSVEYKSCPLYMNSDISLQTSF